MKKAITNIKKWIRRVLLILCICVFCYSAYQLYQIYINYKNIENLSDELIEDYVESEDNNSLDPLNRIIDFERLLNRNEDVIGWIYIPDTTVDEPILKGKNNNTYLRTSIDHKHLSAGCIFIDENNSKDFSDNNTIIYGHNMKNGTRFHDLRYYDDIDYFNEHNSIYLYTLDGSISVYTIFSAKIVEPEDRLYTTTIDNYDDFITNCLNNALNFAYVNTDNKQPIIMLSTCNSEDNTKRNVIFAYLSKKLK